MPASSSLSDSSEGSSTQPSSAILEWMRHAQIRALVVDDATAAALRDEAPPNASLRNYLASEALFDHSQQQLLVPTGTAYSDWLARLCEACRTFDNAGHSSPNFEAAWVSVAQLHVEGTPITQQIDVAVARKRGITPATTSAASGRGLSNVNAADVLVVLEAKYSSTSKSKGDVDERAARYARLLNEHSPSRPHRVCIAVCMSSVALYVFGPSGFFKAEFKRSVASPTPEAMLALQRWARVKFVDALVAEERVDGGSLSLDQGKKVCWKGKPRLVFAKKTLGGSLTNVWRIKVPDGSVKVLKLAWANAAMAQREGETYERLRQSVESFLGAVPTMCSGLSRIVSQGQANDEIESLANVLYWLILQLFVTNDKFLSERRREWEQNVPGKGAQLWGPGITLALYDMAPTLFPFDNVDPTLVPTFLAEIRELFDESFAQRSAGYKPNPAGGKPKLQQKLLHDLHILYGVTEDIDKTLFTGFVKLCNSTVKALLQSNAPVVSVP